MVETLVSKEDNYYSVVLFDSTDRPLTFRAAAVRIYEIMLEVWFEDIDVVWDLLETTNTPDDFPMWISGPNMTMDVRVSWRKECGIRIKGGACLTFHQVLGRCPITGNRLRFSG